jgi:hypothetical protein
VNDWKKIIEKYEYEPKERVSYERLYKNIININSKLNYCKEKCDQLNVLPVLLNKNSNYLFKKRKIEIVDLNESLKRKKTFL